MRATTKTADARTRRQFNAAQTGTVSGTSQHLDAVAGGEQDPSVSGAGAGSLDICYRALSCHRWTISWDLVPLNFAGFLQIASMQSRDRAASAQRISNCRRRFEGVFKIDPHQSPDNTGIHVVVPATADAAEHVHGLICGSPLGVLPEPLFDLAVACLFVPCPKRSLERFLNNKYRRHLFPRRCRRDPEGRRIRVVYGSESCLPTPSRYTRIFRAIRWTTRPIVQVLFTSAAPPIAWGDVCITVEGGIAKDVRLVHQTRDLYYVRPLGGAYSLGGLFGLTGHLAGAFSVGKTPREEVVDR